MTYRCGWQTLLVTRGHVVTDSADKSEVLDYSLHVIGLPSEFMSDRLNSGQSRSTHEAQ